MVTLQMEKIIIAVGPKTSMYMYIMEGEVPQMLSHYPRRVFTGTSSKENHHRRAFKSPHEEPRGYGFT
jgi:hypothetical protein